LDVPHNEKVKWLIKSSRHIFDVPFYIAFHNIPLILTDTYEEINKTQLNMTFFRSDVIGMKTHVHHLVNNGQTMKDLAIFNPGNKYEPYTVRSKPQRIPKIIHQIWVGGTMSEGKRLIMEANRELYPDWEHKLWGSKDITRENFPLSYNLIQTILKINKFTRYSKIATVADVMRHEIMYREGGFYMDTGMKLFNNVFNKWLSYRVVIPTSEAVKNRWVQ
jgi:mannosyltransferase OCH1-like enzyme